jgi:hypothetical protein
MFRSLSEVAFFNEPSLLIRKNTQKGTPEKLRQNTLEKLRQNFCLEQGL